MKRDGFTLVELLLSIVILGLIMAIAIPSVNSVSKSMRESQRKNTIEKIEIAASKYAFDTGETIIFVDKLVTEGYIESDDEDGNINDPVSNGRMNCYVVEMEKQSDYYNATLVDGKNYDNNGVCDLSKLNEDSAEISIEVINNGTSVSNLSNWLKGNVTLKAYSNSLIIDCATNKCVWSSSGGASLTGSDEITLDNVSGTLETKYTFQMTVYDDDTSEVKRYKSVVNLKIDNELPTIYGNELKVTDRFIYTTNKKVTISASDGQGSGIAGYYLALDTNQTCFKSGLSFQSANTFTISNTGNYLICVKDKAGNISGYSGLNITYIK